MVMTIHIANRHHADIIQIYCHCVYNVSHQLYNGKGSESPVSSEWHVLSMRPDGQNNPDMWAPLVSVQLRTIAWGTEQWTITNLMVELIAIYAV